MACCGGSTGRTQTRGLPGASGDPVLFEYHGEGPFTAFGRMTGIRYHFPGPGARLPVDARDVQALALVSGLQRVNAADS